VEILFLSVPVGVPRFFDAVNNRRAKKNDSEKLGFSGWLFDLAATD